MLRKPYRIRKTRDNWSIKFHCYHTDCAHDCSFETEEDKNCSVFNKIEETYVHIDEYDKDTPKGLTGKLYKPDDIIIPENEITIVIDTPLLNIVKINTKTTNRNGFTLRETLDRIKNIYKRIYEEEEKTSSEEHYQIVKWCDFCIDNDIKKNITKCEERVNGDCPICCSAYKEDDEVSYIPCKHYFHKNCIEQWCDYGHTCPLCRGSIKRCDACENKGYITYSYKGKVIPIEERGMMPGVRNMTNGRYGIYLYDLENLYITSMWYNKKRKELKLFVKGFN